MFDPAAAKKRCEAASPGPWTAELDYLSAFIPGKRPNGEIIGRLQPSISDLFPREQKYANAEFIAHARSDLPAALEALEEAQAERDRNLETAKLATRELVRIQMETNRCVCGETEVEHGSPPGSCRSAPCLCQRYRPASVRYGEALSLLKEGADGLSRLLVATGNDKAVRDWTKRVGDFLTDV